MKSLAQCYKTFYGCNLLMFLIKFVPGRLFQPSVIVAGRTSARYYKITLQFGALLAILAKASLTQDRNRSFIALATTGKH
jgi:hypothetical protein